MLETSAAIPRIHDIKHKNNLIYIILRAVSRWLFIDFKGKKYLEDQFQRSGDNPTFWLEDSGAYCGAIYLPFVIIAALSTILLVITLIGLFAFIYPIRLAYAIIDTGQIPEFFL